MFDGLGHWVLAHGCHTMSALSQRSVSAQSARSQRSVRAVRGLRCRDVSCGVAGALDDGSADLGVFAVGSRPAFIAAERSGCAARVRPDSKLLVSTWKWWQPKRARKPAKVDSDANTRTWSCALASSAWPSPKLISTTKWPVRPTAAMPVGTFTAINARRGASWRSAGAGRG